MTGRRVVITGMGVVCPIGATVTEVWDAVAHGRSGIGVVTSFDASSFPTRIAGEVRRDLAMLEWQSVVDAAILRHRKSVFALYAAQQATADAGLRDADLETERAGVFLGVGLTIHAMDQSAIARLVSAKEAPRDLPAQVLEHPATPAYLPGDEMPAEFLAGRLGIGGVCQSIESACAASAHAIGHAFKQIQRGRLDLALAGGADAMINFLGLAGFCLVGATSTYNDAPERACRPFDRTRNGTVISEGAAIVVLEDYERAVARGAEIYAEVVGYGASVDAYRLTDPSPDGRGARLSMTNALADARLTPSDVDYINAHGTATRANDRVETFAIKQVFGAHAKRLAVSSTKSVMGHLVAAAGAVETLVTALALKHQILPPTINYASPDPQCDLDYVPNEARRRNLRVALSNSFGFGGQNGTVVLVRV